ncbi:MAG: hypothetical protein ABIR94_20915 [Rubrivivax sp.]
MSLLIAALSVRTYSAGVAFNTAAMQDSHDQRRILYLASLGAGHEYDAAILMQREARLRSRELQVSGAWLFDGHRICTFVSGASTAIDAWLQAVRADSRNVLNALLCDGRSESCRGTVSWEVGYCEPDDLDAFDGEKGLRGDAALAAFNQLMAQCDMRT